MNLHSATLPRALATLRVALVRFSVARDGDVRFHTTPRAAAADGKPRFQVFPSFPIGVLFDAFALTPRKGTYTLRLADGQLSYDPPVQKIAHAAGKAGRHHPIFARRHEKLAA